MRFIRPALLFPLIASAAVALSGCDLFGERGPVKIAAIGPLTLSATPLSGELSAANAALLDATSQGLARYDAAWQNDDRKTGSQGKGVSIRVDPGGPRV